MGELHFFNSSEISGICQIMRNPFLLKFHSNKPTFLWKYWSIILFKNEVIVFLVKHGRHWKLYAGVGTASGQMGFSRSSYFQPPKSLHWPSERKDPPKHWPRLVLLNFWNCNRNRVYWLDLSTLVSMLAAWIATLYPLLSSLSHLLFLLWACFFIYAWNF